MTLNVRDTQTGTLKTYQNLEGTAFAPIQDTGAFPVRKRTVPFAFRGARPFSRSREGPPRATCLLLTCNEKDDLV